MNKILPYEKELARQLKKLPLPDEDSAWQDMKRRLDKDEDNGAFFFIPLLNGCAGWVLLYGIALTTLLCFLIPGSSATQKNKSTATLTPTEKHQLQPGADKTDTVSLVQRKKQINDSIFAENKNGQDTSLLKIGNSGEISNVAVTEKKKSVIKTGNKNETRFETGVAKRKQRKVKGNTTIKITGGAETEDSDTNVPDNETVNKNDYETADDTAIATIVMKPVNAKQKTDTAVTAEKKPEVKQDNKPDSLAKKEPAKEKSKQTNKIYFAAGAGLWQRIDNIGPKGNAYIPSGSSSGATALKKPFNYVPSVYARMYKGNKWFLQAEFRYKSPKKINNLLYSYSDFTIPFTTTRVITSYYLTNVYFHQLPVTFNYFVTKNWSIGAGISWNKFSSAFATVIREEIISTTGQPASTITANEFKISKTDSSAITGQLRLTDSYFQGIIETQYRWKRFSLGLNYSFGLQPYLKYTPQGTSQLSERNNMLNIFIRYELWKSKQKK